MAIRLVVVDDAPFMREVVRHLLVKHGIDVIGEASDGEEAVKVVRNLRPDVVLMDLIMPKKSGIEATREILEHIPDIRVVACSTTDQQTMVLRALDAGCCDYVVKPFEADKLVGVIRNSIAKK